MEQPDFAPYVHHPLTISFAGGITANSANFSWTLGGNETSWNIQYGIAGFPIGTGNTNNKSFLLTGLNPSTSYDYYSGGL